MLVSLKSQVTINKIRLKFGIYFLGLLILK